MNYSMKRFFRNLYQAEGQQFACRARTEEDFVRWKSAFRAALRERLGLDRMAQIGAGVKDKPAELICETQEAGYRRRKYVMETLPEVFMPFYMLIPDGVCITAYEEKKACAVIAIPAHGANKNTVCGVAETEAEAGKIAGAPDECYGEIFARRGYVVFCPDPPGYGERVEPVPSEDVYFKCSAKRSSLDSSCKDIAQTAEALDLSLTALEIWELQRLLDFACGCPEAAADELGVRIGCAGFSGGGQYSMWLAAMDDRIRLAVVSGYVHGYLDSLLECHLCPCNYAPGLWKLGDISDICSLIAPRPLFVENGMEDVENGPDGIEGPKRQVEKTREVYRVLHQENMLVHSTPAGPHRWYGGCYEFVKETL